MQDEGRWVDAGGAPGGASSSGDDLRRPPKGSRAFSGRSLRAFLPRCGAIAFVGSARRFRPGCTREGRAAGAAEGCETVAIIECPARAGRGVGRRSSTGSRRTAALLDVPAASRRSVSRIEHDRRRGRRARLLRRRRPLFCDTSYRRSRCWRARPRLYGRARSGVIRPRAERSRRFLATDFDTAWRSALSRSVGVALAAWRGHPETCGVHR